MYIDGTSVTYFDSFGDEQIPEKIKKFINFMFKGESLTDFTDLFSLQNFEKDERFLRWYTNMSDTKKYFLQLDKPIQFKLIRIKYFLLLKSMTQKR